MSEHEPMRFGFGVQPDKEGRFVLFRYGAELNRYPSAHAAANAAFLIMEVEFATLRAPVPDSEKAKGLLL